jgi:hypothetical protein
MKPLPMFHTGPRVEPCLRVAARGHTDIICTLTLVLEAAGGLAGTPDASLKGAALSP